MNRTFRLICKFASFSFLLNALPYHIAAQAAPSTADTGGSFSGLQIGLIVLLIAVAAGAIVLKRRKESGNTSLSLGTGSHSAGRKASDDSKMSDSMAANRARTRQSYSPSATELSAAYQHSSPALNREPDTAEVLRNLVENHSFTRLPVSKYIALEPAVRFEPLPHSEDEDLLTAIDEVQEEFDDDVEIRSLAMRILTAFKTSNSVTALSQIALYDLSGTLRSKAVSVLTGFDHESVFEAIVLACADPSREVRAAAARGLFMLSFDRADAWKRIVETDDEPRMRQAARAAIEAGLVERSLERLVHTDEKIAYEAFTLVALLIKAGETEQIFEALAKHKDENVKLALLHILQHVKNEASLHGLNELLDQKVLPLEMTLKVKKTIQSFAGITA